MDNSRGFFLISILFLTLILSFVSLSIYRSARSLTEIIPDRAHSWRAVNDSLTSLETNLISSGPPVSRTNCLHGQSTHGRATIKRLLCSQNQLTTSQILSQNLISGNFLQDRSFFPQINFNSIFRNFSSCSPIQLNSVGTTYSGHLLSLSSSVAPNTCVIGQAGISRLVTGENLDGASVDIVGTGLNQIPIIGSLGYIDIATITTNSSAYLIAGGDLKVNSITNLSGSTVSLVLISGSGSVSVNSIQGSVSVKAIAWNGINIPSNTGMTNSLPILSQEKLLIGMQR